MTMVETPAGPRDLNELELRMLGYCTATAEILYYLPDHPNILQSFTWQTLDLAPKFPRIHKFLNYWREHIEATVHSVGVTSQRLISPGDLRPARGDFQLH